MIRSSYALSPPQWRPASIADVLEMKDFLRILKQAKDCELFQHVEEREIGKYHGEYDGLDWAEIGGSEVLHDYWALAATQQRQTQLATLCHARGKAWLAVWSKFL